MKNWLLILSCTVLLYACATQTPLLPIESNLGTQGALQSRFHPTAIQDHAHGLAFSGYLVGVEKTKRKMIGAPKTHPTPTSMTDAVRYMLPILNRPEITFISHIIQYHSHTNLGGMTFIKEKPIYSIYKNHKKIETRTAYKNSYQAISKLQETLSIQMQHHKDNGTPYTHILLYAMGWNTDQQLAIQNYNSLMRQLFKTQPKNTPFNPLFIGITWPSEWDALALGSLVKTLSYPTKANDADAIGARWISKLLHQVLIPLKYKGHIPLILVGHSFGARLLSRAVFSPEFIHPPQLYPHHKKEDINLFIGLQGAFNINRFIPDETDNEGAPYRHFNQFAQKFIFTWSQHDTANPLAKYITNSNHIGGKFGYLKSTEYPILFDQFKTHIKHGKLDRFFNVQFVNIIPTGEANWAKSRLDPDVIAMVDASDLIQYESNTRGGGAHSDIYTPGLARFIWYSMRLK